MEYLVQPQIEECLKNMDQEYQEYIWEYFKNAPAWVWQAISVQRVKKNEAFVREGEKIQSIHMMVKGLVKATDCRVYGAMYDFMWFRPMKVFGALEVIPKEEEYKTTLTTNEDCIFWVMPRSVYEQWMEMDSHAFRIEATATAHGLLKQTRRERVYLFMQGMDRMAYFLLHYYESFGKEGACRITLTRQDISDCTGLSVKTVNRSIASLEEFGCILKEGSRLIITENEFKELQNYVSELIV
ncbi:MAG: Crp/Fnr family transcriptional regulator [Clostridiales bacterium]|nr:Crp/Fnr family transcriptional regulator [Clostridiales bacterium]